jgi:hypothetical protein
LAARAASKVREPAIPYALGGRSDAGTDCINLIGWCVQELGGKKDDIPRGSNTAWRTVMQWRGTLAEAKAQGKLVPGALVYICDAPTAQWPEGDFGHVGVYVGRKDIEVVHASASRGGVYPSTLKNAWNHVAWPTCVSYTTKTEKPEGGTTTVLYQATVTTQENALNLRATPAATAARVGTVPRGTLVDVLEETTGWRRIQFAGTTAWASADYLQRAGADTPEDGTIPALRSARAALDQALQKLGAI